MANLYKKQSDPMSGENRKTGQSSHYNNTNGRVDFSSFISKSRERVKNTIKTGSVCQVERSDQVLVDHINSKIKLIVLYVDLVGSTIMTQSLPVSQLAAIIQTFTQEMSQAVSLFNGYVLKYVGDAIIAYFPAFPVFDESCNLAIGCSNAMLATLKEGVNSVFRENGYKELEAKIGIDTSEHSIIKYMLGEKSHVDILGYGISMAAKLSSLAGAGHVAISHSIYFGMDPSYRKKYIQMDLDPRMWKYIDQKFHPVVWKTID